MKVGDLVYDFSLGQRGIIIETKKQSMSYKEDPVFEHIILYENGNINAAGEYDLEECV